MAISAITRFINVQTLVKNTNVNSTVCTSYLATAKHLNARSKFSGTPTNSETVNENEVQSFEHEDAHPRKPVFISAQMRRYVQKAKAHEDFMNIQIAEYEIGLRHLANIMGEDVEILKNHGTKRYIRYLFPSGLYEKKARPVLEHPSVLFPAQKDAEFDFTGRPHHAFFYTITPKYYKLLHDMVGWIEILDDKEDRANKYKSAPIAGESKLNLKELIPIAKETLEKELMEKLSPEQYEYFLTSMERLIDHPFSKDAIKFVMMYYTHKAETKTAINIPNLMNDENGRPYVKITNCLRKSTRGEVVVYGDGSGKIEINGHDISYFREQHFRTQVSTNNSFGFLYLTK